MPQQDDQNHVEKFNTEQIAAIKNDPHLTTWNAAH